MGNKIPLIEIRNAHQTSNEQGAQTKEEQNIFLLMLQSVQPSAEMQVDLRPAFDSATKLWLANKC